MGFKSERSRIVDTHLEIFIFYDVGQSDQLLNMCVSVCGFCFVCVMLGNSFQNKG